MAKILPGIYAGKPVFFCHHPNRDNKEEEKKLRDQRLKGTIKQGSERSSFVNRNYFSYLNLLRNKSCLKGQIN